MSLCLLGFHLFLVLQRARSSCAPHGINIVSVRGWLGVAVGLCATTLCRRCLLLGLLFGCCLLAPLDHLSRLYFPPAGGLRWSCVLQHSLYLMITKHLCLPSLRACATSVRARRASRGSAFLTRSSSGRRTGYARRLAWCASSLPFATTHKHGCGQVAKGR